MYLLSQQHQGVTYNNKLQLSGATKLADGTATIKVNVEKTAKITLVAAAKGASGEGTNLIYAKTGVTSGTAIGQLGVTDEIGTYTLENVKPGTYYIGSAKGADIYDIKVEYDPEENKQAVAWDTVESPVINSVTTDADGNFVVNFTSVIDELKGAELHLHHSGQVIIHSQQLHRELVQLISQVVHIVMVHIHLQ